MLGYNSQQLEKIENQWCSLSVVNLHENQSTVKLWTEIGNYRDASGNNVFQELNDLAISLPCLPHSNAEVERLFSQMNTVKSKPRNRLSTSSVNAVLSVKSGLRRVKKCCYSNELPAKVTCQTGAMATYAPPQPQEVSTSTASVLLTPDTDANDRDFFFFSAYLKR